MGKCTEPGFGYIELSCSGKRLKLVLFGSINPTCERLLWQLKTGLELARWIASAVWKQWKWIQEGQHSIMCADINCVSWYSYSRSLWRVYINCNFKNIVL